MDAKQIVGLLVFFVGLGLLGFVTWLNVHQLDNIVLLIFTPVVGVGGWVVTVIGLLLLIEEEEYVNQD